MINNFVICSRLTVHYINYRETFHQDVYGFVDMHDFWSESLLNKESDKNADEMLFMIEGSFKCAIRNC